MLEKEISKEEVIGVIELYKRISVAPETAQLQKIVLQMDKYGVRGTTVSSPLEEREMFQGPFVCLDREHPPASVVLGLSFWRDSAASQNFAALEKQQLLLA